MHRQLAVAAVALSALAGAAAVARAEAVAGQPDESIQQAYPIDPGHTYSGAFDDSAYPNSSDVDYLVFQVTQPNQTVQFQLANTTRTCNDPNDAGCPVYATLMDSSDQQLGGDSSAAGTIATYGDTEVFQWQFATPGTYYLLMESNGDEAPGNPSYSVNFGALSPSGSSGGSGSSGSGSTAPLVRSLKVAPRQHAASVLATVVTGRAGERLTATLRLVNPGHPATYIARVSRRFTSAGPHRLRVRLPPERRAALRRKHRLPVLFNLVASVRGHQVTATRHVLLLAP